jgi:hypothetical protein
MGAASNASSDGGRWSETPLARGLLFLSIVWSIAGAFLVLQNLLPELVEQTVTRGWVSPDIAVNRNLDEEAQRRCAEPQTAARPAPSLATLQRARYTAYQMGFGFGTAAVAHTSGTNQRELIVRALQEVQREAMVLGVPPPELPVIRHMAAALGEFADDLETDRQCTGWLFRSLLRERPVHRVRGANSPLRAGGRIARAPLAAAGAGIARRRSRGECNGEDRADHRRSRQPYPDRPLNR